MLPCRSRALDLAPRGCQHVCQTLRENDSHHQTFVNSTQDEGQADIPDEPQTGEDVLQQMLLWLGASHSCHLLASQTPVSIQDHAWRSMRQHLHSNGQIDGSVSWHTVQNTRSRTDCVAGVLPCVRASVQASMNSSIEVIHWVLCTWPRASTRTDLPAPLSPVMTFSPGLKLTFCSSIKAKFLPEQQHRP